MSKIKNQKSKIKTGFTLIELLVVIAIISVLTALSLPNFILSRQRARDAQRKSDIRQTQKALELYKQDQSPASYPSNDIFNGIPCGGIFAVGKGNNSTIYMNKFPCDPLSGRYTYTLNIFDSTRYFLYACLENSSDQDGVWQPACTSGKMYQVTEP